jgi:Holliday junction DNA helicase RuvA
VISGLRGMVQHVSEGEIHLDVGGVVLRVLVPSSVVGAIPRAGEACYLHAELVVRENSLSVFGFLDSEARDVFRILLQVSGVGPRLALGILSHFTPQSLRQAVARQDSGAFTRVPGIGRKTAEKILFHLKDRLGPSAPAARVLSAADGEVLAALTSLGYSLVEAQAALQSLPADQDGNVEHRVRLALQYFARP